MRKGTLALASTLVIVLTTDASPASAGCLPHQHAGKASAATKAGAERLAILDWCRAVRQHDGDRWTYFGLAGSVPKCEAAGTLWRCTAMAQPCRPSSGGTRNHCVVDPRSP
jgi:hypothetical protein